MTLVDTEGNALVGAHLELHLAPANAPFDLLRLGEPTWIAESDADGMASAVAWRQSEQPGDTTTEGEVLGLRVRFADGLEARRLLLAHRKEVTVVVPATRPLEVRTRDDAGRPLAEVATILRVTGTWGRSPSTLIFSRATTDRAGIASLRWPSGSEARLYAAHEERVPALAFLSPSMAAGQTPTLTLETGREAPLQIIDAQGRQAPGAVARFGEHVLATADSEGRLSLRLGSKPIAIELATAEGLSAESQLQAAPRDRPLRVQLAPPIELWGEVIEGDSRRGLPGALLVAAEIGAVTAEDGRFLVQVPRARLSARTTLVARAAKPGFTSEARAAPVLDDRALVQIPLHPTVDLRGRVVDLQGHPIAGAQLEGGGLTAISDHSGHFRFSDLRAGTSLEILARADGFAPGRIDVTVARQEQEPVEIVLVAGARAGGRVVDEDDLPVVGASLSLRRRIAGSYFRDRHDDPLTGSSDNDGRFAFADLVAGPYDLDIRAPGLAPLEVAGLEVEPAARDVDFGTHRLERGITQEGIVVDGEGAALSGARVEAYGQHPSWKWESESDERGRFLLEDLPRGDGLHLVVSLEGWVPSALDIQEAPTLSPLEIVLHPSGSLPGRVVGEGGQPIGEALISLRSADSRQYGKAATSGLDGRFLIEGTRPGRWMVTARAEGYAQDEIGPIEILADIAPPDLTITLLPALTLHGRVIDDRDRPLAGAAVQALPAGETTSMAIDRRRTTHSDQQGHYRLSGLSPGEIQVTAKHHGYDPTVRDLVLAQGETHLDLALQPSAALPVRVLDAEGSPVAGAVIVDLVSQLATTDAEGRATLHLDRGREHTLQAYKDGVGFSREYGPYRSDQSLPALLDILIEPGARIVGTVIGLDPGEMAQVEVVASHAREGFSRLGLRHSRVGRDGTFTIESVAPGAWLVQATGPGGRVVESLELAPGETEVHLTLDLAPGHRLTGAVLRNGEPVSGLRLRARGEGGGGQTRTGIDGRFAFAGLAAGSYEIRVQSDSHTVHRQTIHLDGDLDLLIELSSARVAGTVVEEGTQQAIGGAAVELVLAAPQLFAPAAFPSPRLTGGDGGFAFEGVAPGRHRLQVRAEGFGAKVLEIEVDELGSEEVWIELAPADSLVLQILLPNGWPASGRSLVLRTASPDGVLMSIGSYTAGEEGSLRLDSLGAGTWWLYATARDGAQAVARISLPRAETETLRLQLVRGGRLQIEAAPWIGRGTLSPLVLQAGGGIPWTGLHPGAPDLALVDGRLLPVSLLPGLWTIEIEMPDGTTAHRQINVVAGAKHEVRFD